MLGQGTPAGPAFGGTFPALFGIALLRLGCALGNGLFQRLQTELQLLLWKTFGFGAELHAFEPEQQMAQAIVLLGQSLMVVASSAISVSTMARRPSTSSGRLGWVWFAALIACESYAATTGL
jgi:hypothetical protein